jgi:hypothetical protein
MRATTTARHERIRARFLELFEETGVRFDDSVQRVADEFFLSPATVERILWQRTKPQPRPDGQHQPAADG